MTGGSLKAVGWARSFPAAGGARAGRRWTREHLAALGWTADAPGTVDDLLPKVSGLGTCSSQNARAFRPGVIGLELELRSGGVGCASVLTCTLLRCQWGLLGSGV
ncbi:hypothetical protein SAMN05216252_11091 [Actinacidiphila glaucinigra]|uniref:Uncharacterized protein n=1 Tax=Actinacidiphila glaucinigra TaxID=235986 RepID=A0A239IDJ3_9ACTN|nr:hypothetical protein SAMN05216252_11091 [Actinacidiphila glaucinigra]